MQHPALAWQRRGLMRGSGRSAEAAWQPPSPAQPARGFLAARLEDQMIAWLLIVVGVLGIGAIAVYSAYLMHMITRQSSWME